MTFKVRSTKFDVWECRFSVVLLFGRDFFLAIVSKTILLLESDLAVRELVQSAVTSHDLSLETAHDSEDAVRFIAQENALAFAFNAGRIAGSPLDFIRRLKQRHPGLPILAILDDSRRDMEVELLQAGIHACLNLPLRLEDLSQNLLRIIADNSERHNPFSMLYEERTLIVPNDLSLVIQTAKSLVDGALPATGRNRYHLILGLAEIINNAIEHGNLGISYEEKRRALESFTFYSLAIERANQQPYKNRVTTVRSRIFPEARKIEFTVADQGEGFDRGAAADARALADVLARSGRGIMMARHAFDSLTYNQTGNEATLIVNLDTAHRERSI